MDANRSRASFETPLQLASFYDGARNREINLTVSRVGRYVAIDIAQILWLVSHHENFENLCRFL